MNIAILGATGNFGITLTSKLLAVSDHHLTLISTSAGSKFEDNYRITAKNVDATNIKTLKKALKDSDLVYCAIAGDYLPVMVDNIISCEPKRLIFMTTVGVYNELENAAQLLTQVSGRSGRGNKKGRVIIQTHHKDNLLINQLINPDCTYLNIAEELLKTRKNLMLPPYTYQAFILSNSSERINAYSFLNQLYSELSGIAYNYSNLALTPVMSDKMEKQQNRYHFHMLVTCVSRKTLNMFLTEVRNMVSRKSLSQDLRFAIEVDPIIMC